MDSVVYVDEQRTLRSDCTDAHADLDLRCPQMYKGLFRALRIKFTDVYPSMQWLYVSHINNFLSRFSKSKVNKTKLTQELT